MEAKLATSLPGRGEFFHGADIRSPSLSQSKRLNAFDGGTLLEDFLIYNSFSLIKNSHDLEKFFKLFVNKHFKPK